MKEIIDFLEESRRDHCYCDNCWYSCPRHPGILELDDPDYSCDIECDCGADEYNAKLDRILFTAKAQLQINA